MAASSEARSLEQTSTWAVAVVSLVFVVISLVIEESINGIGKWLTKHNKKALYEALEKIKAELMVLGFISLLLTVAQTRVAKICISESLANTMLPCKNHQNETEDSSENHRKLVSGALFSDQEGLHKRILSSASTSSCSEGKVPIISENALHQLHIFIFVLAIFQVLYSVLTMGLGRAKMYSWRAWEQEVETMDYQLSNDPSRFRLTHETSFVRRHLHFWYRIPIFIWIECFFQQLLCSVTKVDYLTLRHGFISAHLAPESRFNFHKYIERSLEDDFKKVVGISLPLWAFAVIFILLNVHGWQTYFWLSFSPLIIILLVGTKLQVIITKMALDIQSRHAVVQGTPLVQPSDEHFWSGRPQLILFLIHFTLFQNAFEVAFFCFIWLQFGLKSCFHENFGFIITRFAMGVGVQFLCSYITLPLYALVTQMGSNMKEAIFNEQTSTAVKRWHQAAKRNMKQNKRSGIFPGFKSGESSNQGSSPAHLLHRYKTVGYLDRRQPAERLYHSEYEMSDIEMDDAPPPSIHSRSPSTTEEKDNTESMGQPTSRIVEDTDNTDFSFPNL